MTEAEAALARQTPLSPLPFLPFSLSPISPRVASHTRRDGSLAGDGKQRGDRRRSPQLAVAAQRPAGAARAEEAEPRPGKRRQERGQQGALRPAQRRGGED